MGVLLFQKKYTPDKRRIPESIKSKVCKVKSPPIKKTALAGGSHFSLFAINVFPDRAMNPCALGHASPCLW